MSITASDFLNSAKELMVDQSEPATRNSVSRAYYAAFHQTNGVYSPNPEFAKESKVGMHQTYIDQLMRADTGSRERTVAVKLSSMKGKRVKADYQLTETMMSYIAALQMRTAEEIFQLLSFEQEARTPDEKIPQTAYESPLPLRTSSRPKLTRIL